LFLHSTSGNTVARFAKIPRKFFSFCLLFSFRQRSDFLFYWNLALHSTSGNTVARFAKIPRKFFSFCLLFLFSKEKVS